jgi:hypothetical protein
MAEHQTAADVAASRWEKQPITRGDVVTLAVG